MIKLLVALVLSIQLSWAAEIDKSEVESMLRSMQASGILTDQQVVEASTKLKGLSDKEWDSIKDRGAVIAKKHKQTYSPSKGQTNLRSPAQKMDLNSDEFLKIQQQVKEIMNKN
ncbi:hypothetical protein [Halobacteriovorax sp. HLS]|uniref:hypothetical protein n=1 Tax=Halobacteriovorax sp. HLS TaxID=2234000 RepID=UPI000FDBF1FC|nr:hypothetical protein [Halobacteriovorax sp. HLS]